MKFIIGLIFLLLFIPILKTYSQNDSLIISEIMFYPSAPNSEFVEIFNLSYQNSIDLSKYQIIYSTANADTILKTSDGTNLLPRSFAVVFEGDYDLTNGIYAEMVSSNSIKLQIEDNYFGSSGMANTSDRIVLLVNSIGDTVDAYYYSANNNSGISDEKIILNKDSSSISWANSLIINGTPGIENSVSSKEYDLAVTDLFYSPTEIFEGNEVQFTSVVKNIGASISNDFTVLFFIDINSDATVQQNEIIGSQNYGSLLPADSIEIIGQSSSLPAGNYDLFVEVDFDADENVLNNTKTLNINIISKLNSYNDLIISEIMYAPVDDEPEWLEIYNRSDSIINLDNWKIADKISSRFIIDSTFLIQPHEFVVLSDDESIHDYYSISSPIILVNLPSLNNNGDNLKLLDSLKREVDSVNFTSNWGGTGGSSLEKIDPDANGNDSSNWESSVSSFGGTPGKTNSLTPKEYDLAINQFFIENNIAFVGKSIQLNTIVQNIGIRISGNYLLQIFHDANTDSIGQENEFLYQFHETALAPNDSASLLIEVADHSSGFNQYLAKLNFIEDLNIKNNIAILNFIGVETNEIRNDLVINEIMYTPNRPEPEWIEIFNRSDKTVNLKNYQIADETDTTKVIDDNLMIQPRKFMVIAKDSAFISIYSETLNFMISDFSILNNTGDRLIILDSLNRVIDSLDFNPNWGGNNGISLERVSSELASIDSANWGSAKFDSGGTPGTVNSITSKEYDLAISQFFTEKDFVLIGDTVQVNSIVNNVGTNASGNYSLQIYHDTNIDSIANENEIIYQFNETGLTSNDSTVLSFELSNEKSGINYFIAKLVYDEDINIENNIAYMRLISVEINEIRNDIVINEIMYAPNKPEPEWIEIINRSDKAINLKNYQIADEVNTTKVIDFDLMFLPFQYFVIASDSSFLSIYSDTLNFMISDFPNLNNTGDRLIILDSLNRVIDSLEFDPIWGGKNGMSLERFSSEITSIDSANWGSAKMDSGGTPGKINSISQRDFDVEVSQLNFNPSIPLFSEQVKISVNLTNIGKNNLTCSLQLFEDIDFDSTNIQLLETINLIQINNGDSINVELDYTIDSLKGTRAFIADVYAEVDQDTSNNKLYSVLSPKYNQNTLVVNEIMYSPINGEPEWIEFYNQDANEVNLKNWIISDIYTTPKIIEITDQNIQIQGNEYFVIAKDSTLWEYHKNIPSPVLLTNFANLNNDIDGVVLKDQHESMIDSVEYNSSWGGTSGYSLEKQFPHYGSNDSSNWSSSLDIELSTPGRKNSITPKNFDLKINSLTTIPEFPTINNDVFVNAVVQNVGINRIDNYSVSIKISVKNIIAELELFNNLSLGSSDSLILKTEKSFISDDSTQIICEVISALDNDTTNNFYSIMLNPSFMKNSIVINEFMANPQKENAEWIELYNNSQTQINIKNWLFSDLLSSPTKKKITEDDIIINSEEYFVITSDTSIFNVAGDIKTFEVNFGALGNYGDGILLYDFNNKIIDSLSYNKEWKIEKGRSLERVSFDPPTSEIYNWLPSLSVTGSTPGTNNSILETRPYTRGSIKINEIMYDPDNNNSEFIELYNNTDSPIDIGGWTLVDGSDNYFEISKTFFELNHNDYFIFAADSSVLEIYTELQNNTAIIISNTGNLSLSNDEEIIMIVDHWGNVIDSINYNSKWHNENLNITTNKSLERINPNLDGNDETNWSTSVASIGATPIGPNSIYTTGINSEVKLSFSPNPFSPDNDGYEDFTLINYNLSISTAQIRIKIFDDKGRLVRTLINNKASSSSGTEIFDGLDDSGNPLRIGMYIVFVEASNSTNGVVDILKDVIVIARKL